MSEYNPQGMQMFPPGVKNLLIINVLMFLAAYVVKRSMGVDLDDYLALHAVQSSLFQPWQYITYMFMHGGIDHILFNMFALWMFGYVLENFWGTTRFVIFYMVCGLGAGIVHTLVTGIDVHMAQQAVNNYAVGPNPDAMMALLDSRFSRMYNPTAVADFLSEWRSNGVDSEYGMLSVQLMQQLVDFKASIPTVGASGAVYGILLAFGMMFPNEQIYLSMVLPIKAKWFVVFYGALELFLGVFHTADGIAHFAHLGGMLFGLILILLWRRHNRVY